MKYSINVLLLCLVFSAPAWAKGKIILPDACGNDAVLFKVDDNANHAPLPAPDSGKALIVVGHVRDTPKGDIKNIRIGMDGSWVGALNNGESDYFAFSVSPGEHHFCFTFGAHGLLEDSRFQASVATSKRMLTLAITAEAGHIYYIEAKHQAPGESDPLPGFFSVEQLTEDDGKFMVKSHDYATSTPVK